MTNSSPVISGAEITYILIVRNNGPSSAQNVVVTNTLPANVTFEGATPWLGGRYVLNGGILIFNWPGQTLKPGSSLTNLVYVQATTGQYITNIATVYGPLPDPFRPNRHLYECGAVAGGGFGVEHGSFPDSCCRRPNFTDTILHFEHWPCGQRERCGRQISIQPIGPISPCSRRREATLLPVTLFLSLSACCPPTNPPP